MSKPLLFIGSSSESKPLANALQESLSDELSSLVWSQVGTPLSKQVLEGLEERIEQADFAAFILGPDDEVVMRGNTSGVTRDNVLLEFGLARGLLGRDRAFMVMPPPSDSEFHLPTDLVGLIGATYDLKAAVRNAGDVAGLRAILLDAANEIRREARSRGPKPKDPSPTPERRVDGVLDRGSTDALNELADAAIYVSDKRHEYPKSLRRFVQDSEVVPSKYLYWTPQASEHWLELCNQRKYQYYRNSLRVLRSKAPKIASKVVDATGTAQIDLVSVGSGDGIKDNVLLRHLRKELKTDEFIYYYPVDISDTLIVEAIRNALRGGLKRERERFRVKALIADFLKLEELKAFYEERPEPNLFSVLGNTVGNADEDKLIDSVTEAMMPGDLVLLEVNVGKASLDDPIWRDIVTLEHDFTPLSVLGVDFDKNEMAYTEHQGEGIVDGTNSIVASYKEALIDDKSIKDVKLSVVHYYEPDHFLATIQERMNVNVVWSEATGDVFLVLAQREKEGGES